MDNSLDRAADDGVNSASNQNLGMCIEIDVPTPQPAFLQPDDIDNIAIIQSATEGKVAVVEGGGHTIEAWELERKMRTFQQLRMARRLRATMESAYEDAKKSKSTNAALEIFESHHKTMIQMISLTDAVKGGYTLDRYDDYAKIISEKAKNDARSHLTAQSIFSDVRKRMAFENSTELFVQESRAEQLDRQMAVEKFASKKRSSTSNYNKNATPRPPQTPAPVPSSPLPSKSKKIKTNSHVLNVKPSIIEKRPSITSSQEQVAPAPKPKPTTATQPKQAKKPKNILKKCHYCKVLKPDYLSCTFWHINGRQCKKHFCKACLQNNPKFEDKVQSDWHCPACLGVCDCDTCGRAKNQGRLSARVPRRRWN